MRSPFEGPLRIIHHDEVDTETGRRERIPAASSELIALFERALREQAAHFREELLRDSFPISPELESILPDIEHWHEERFQRLGIKVKPRWSPDVRMKNSVKAKRPEDLEDEGQAALGVILLKNHADIPETVPIESLTHTEGFPPISVPAEIFEGLDRQRAISELRNLRHASLLYHEKYHQTKPSEFILETWSDGTTNIKPTLAGSALEEGMAADIEVRTLELVAQRFPLGATLYRRLLEYVLQVDPRLKPFKESVGTDLDKYFVIRGFDGTRLLYSTRHNIGSRSLVSYISGELGNDRFETAVEELRMIGDEKPLEDLLIGHFGPEAFLLLKSAIADKNDHDVRDRLIELRAQIKSRPGL